jgi:hypothetical protein
MRLLPNVVHGYQEWSRSIVVGGGAARVNAEMVANWFGSYSGHNDDRRGPLS